MKVTHTCEHTGFNELMKIQLYHAQTHRVEDGDSKLSDLVLQLHTHTRTQLVNKFYLGKKKITV